MLKPRIVKHYLGTQLGSFGNYNLINGEIKRVAYWVSFRITHFKTKMKVGKNIVYFYLN